MKYIILDTETTGLDPKRCAIIQLGGILIDGDYREEFSLNLAPHEGAVIEAAAQEKHGMTLDEIYKFPSQDKVYKAFVNFLATHCDRFNRKDKYHLIGYNCQFDINFLREWFSRNGDEYFGSWFYTPAIDLMMLAAWKLRHKREELDNFKLINVYRYIVGKELVDAHDALGDSRAVEQILKEMENGKEEDPLLHEEGKELVLQEQWYNHREGAC